MFASPKLENIFLTRLLKKIGKYQKHLNIVDNIVGTVEKGIKSNQKIC